MRSVRSQFATTKNKNKGIYSMKSREAQGLPKRKDLMQSWVQMYQAALNDDQGRVGRLIDNHLEILGDKSKQARERINTTIMNCAARGSLEKTLATVKSAARLA